uniref:Serine carboxypeptidase-like 18 n=1 Tax=Aegilops tauschii TaxID=37682 RepID=N1QU37_AEGTA
MIRRLLLLLCQLAVAGAASSSKVVTRLPGFQGRLPFHLETGYPILASSSANFSTHHGGGRYVEVDDDSGTELFYYFVESEAGGEDAPFLLWLTGGDHCSVLSSLAFEIGTSCLRSQPMTRRYSLLRRIIHEMHTHVNRDCRSIQVE